MPRERKGPVRAMARLTADMIDVTVSVITTPADWAVTALRRYAGPADEPPAKADGADSGSER